jgi:hypothetical protein
MAPIRPHGPSLFVPNVSVKPQEKIVRAPEDPPPGENFWNLQLETAAPLKPPKPKETQNLFKSLPRQPKLRISLVDPLAEASQPSAVPDISSESPCQATGNAAADGGRKNSVQLAAFPFADPLLPDVNIRGDQNDDGSDIDDLKDDLVSDKNPLPLSLMIYAKMSSPIPDLQQVNDLLTKLFLNNPVREADCELPNGQDEIICAILIRKFGKRLPRRGTVTDSHTRPSYLNAAFQTVSIGKSKECIKLILRRVFRKLKSEFFRHTGLGSKKAHSFYDFYFREISEATGRPIAAYFYPFDGKNKFAREFRGKQYEVKMEYYKRIFGCPRFLRDTIQVLKKIRGEHHNEVKLKLHRLMTKWRFGEDVRPDDWQHVRRWTVEFLLNNRRSKVPFTLHEIDHSLRLFVRMICRVAIETGAPELMEILKNEPFIMEHVTALGIKLI